MPLYLTRFSYTPETWARMAANPEDRRDAARAYIESVGTDERRARIIFVEVVGAGPRVEQYRLARRTQWAELFEAVTRTIDGGIVDPPERFEMVSIAFIGAVNDLAHHWSTASPRPSASVLVDVLSTMLIALVTDQT